MLQFNEEVSVNQKLYKIIKLLGHGKGGYSYLAEKDGKKFVLKQIHHEPCSYYTFGNKIESEYWDYKRLEQIRIRMPKMIDVDIKEERIIKEYIEGETIFDLVLKDKVQADYINQIKEMCAILYPAKINIDYFPTNFVVQNQLLYYIDYECNEYMDEWNFENWGIKYWSKTPEFLEYISSNFMNFSTGQIP